MFKLNIVIHFIILWFSLKKLWCGCANNAWQKRTQQMSASDFFRSSPRHRRSCTVPTAPDHSMLDCPCDPGGKPWPKGSYSLWLPQRLTANHTVTGVKPNYPHPLKEGISLVMKWPLSLIIAKQFKQAPLLLGTSNILGIMTPCSQGKLHDCEKVTVFLAQLMGKR